MIDEPLYAYDLPCSEYLMNATQLPFERVPQTLIFIANVEQMITKQSVLQNPCN